MKVVSLVPSITETLLEANVNVIGRTHYCIHPADKIEKIPVVGGTKKVHWHKVKELSPDLVIFEKEENRKEDFNQCPYPKVDLHVLDLKTLGEAFYRLAEALEDNANLLDYASRLKALLDTKLKKDERRALLASQMDISCEMLIPPVCYVIWRDPWMRVSSGTFISSVFGFLGVELMASSEKYPAFKWSEVNRDSFVLYSTEPYSFGENQDSLAEWCSPREFLTVDGESFSWFGVRSLEFLENLLRKKV